MRSLFSDATTEFDDDISDQVESELFTRDWVQYGTLEENKCKEHDLVPTKGCVKCNHDPSLLPGCKKLNIVYLSRTFDHEIDDDPSPPVRYNELRRHGYELASAEFMPIDPKCCYTLAPYLEKNVGPPGKGELLMNVCTAYTKTPCVKIEWCIIGKYKGKVPDGFEFLEVGGENWVLFTPLTAMNDISTMMEEHNMYPTPSPHDGRAYSSSRLQLASNISTRRIDKSEWRQGPDLRSIQRYLNCDAVATASFTVTVHLTPFKGNTGRKSRYRHVNLYLHSIT